VKCNYKSTYGDLKEICQDIKEQVGFEPVIYSTTDKYCAYAKLNAPGRYYCVDSSFTAISTYINPGQTGYCTGKTFVCPKTSGAMPPEALPEMVGFSKEVVDGFEIYSLPISDNLGLDFSIKDKKLIFTFSKDVLLEILKNLDGQKLKDSKIFAEKFKEIPPQVSEISFTYPYGFLGVIKHLVNFYFGIMESYSPEMTTEIETASPYIEEFLNKAIAPYLKVLKSANAFSYSPEKGLVIAKSKLQIEELSAEEKKSTEEFLDNLPNWEREIEEKTTSIPSEEGLSPTIPEGFKTYRNEEYGYSISYPENWKEEKAPLESQELDVIHGIAFQSPIHIDEGFSLTISRGSLEDFMQKFFGMEVKEIKMKEVIVNRQKGYEIDIRDLFVKKLMQQALEQGVPPEIAEEEIKKKAMEEMPPMKMVIFSSGQRQYNIICTASENICDKIINSFVIK
jgi:hypothetical protein